MSSLPSALDGGSSAIAEIERYLSSHPDDPSAHYQLGVHYQAHGEKEKAHLHLRAAATLSPAQVGYIKALADFTYVDLGDPEEAVKLYVRVLERNPRETDSLTILGNIAVSLRRFSEARVFFERLHAIEPWNLTAQKTLDAIARVSDGGNGQSRASVTHADAVAKAREGDATAALGMLGEVVARDPRHALAHNDLGVLLYAAGEKARAFLEYETAVRLDPGNSLFRKNLADFLFAEQGDTEHALEHYVQVLQKNPADVETLTAVGTICLTRGNLDDARAFFTAVLHHDPSHRHAREALASLNPAEDPSVPALAGDIPPLTANPKVERILREKEQFAREYLREVVASDPGNASARHHLDALAFSCHTDPPESDEARERHAEAVRLVQTGYAGEAEALLGELLEKFPWYAPGHNDLAVLQANRGALEPARRHYEEAVRLDPSSPLFRKNFADFAFALLDRKEEAMQLYLGLLRENPCDIEILSAIARLCEVLALSDDAKAFYERILQLDPGHVDARAALEH